jgi:hypothetical protein
MSRRSSDESSGQRERLAAALRANLKRRKDQARARRNPSAPEDQDQRPDPASQPEAPEGDAARR